MKDASKSILMASSLIVLAASVVYGQQTAPQAPPPPAGATAAPAAAVAQAPAAAASPVASGTVVLQEGTDVDLTFDQDLSSKTSVEGDPVIFVLADDVKVGNVVVAKAGCKAFGEVSRAEKAGMMGKPGDLSVRLDYLKVGETRIMLRGTKGNEGQSGTGSAVALTVLFGPIGLIKHGHNIEIKKGTALKAFVANDVALSPAS